MSKVNLSTHTTQGVALAFGNEGEDAQTVSQDSPLPVSMVGAGSGLTADDLRSTASAPTTVPSAATSTTILAANPDRKGFVIVNTDANVLYLNLAGGVATVNGVPVATYYEDPFGITNAITGIWAADGSGQATVWEML